MRTEELWKRAECLAKRPYTSVIAPDDDTFFVSNPELPGCMSDGLTEAEALANLLDARTAYIASLLEDGLDVPNPGD